MSASAWRCINMQRYHGRLVRIPVRRQRAHQPGQILAFVSPLYGSRSDGRRYPVYRRRHCRAALHHHGGYCPHSVAALGVSITTERLHDRDKSAWWLVVFYLVPGVLGQLAKTAWFAGATGAVLHYILALASFALTIWGFVEIGCLRGTAGSNTYGPDSLLQSRRRG